MPRETLTSRERVIRTLRHEPVDRVPIDLGSHTSTGISAFAYWRLREHLGLDTDRIWVPDVVQFLAMVDEDIRLRFHCDCIMLEPAWPETKSWQPREPYTFAIPASLTPEPTPDGGWRVARGDQSMRMPRDGFFFDGDWIRSWQDLPEEQALSLYAQRAEWIYKETPYATNFIGYTRGIGFGSFFGGIEQAVLMLTEPEQVLEENEARCDQSIDRFRRVNAAMGPYIQLVTIGNDMGMQTGPLCRPEHIERFCIPFYRRFCDFVHQNSDIKVYMHNCGGIRPLIPLLIEAGIDALNPVQISAADMDPQGLKASFGDRIVFWGGGCDTQNVLGPSTPDQVADHVRHLMRIFRPGGGFVFAQVHNILGNVPPENIVAMLDAAYEASFVDGKEASD